MWADNDYTTGSGLHANFKLSKSGEYAILSKGTRAMLDSVGFGAQTSDVTWGRLPNGTGPCRPLTPTFGAQNQAQALAAASAATSQVALYPNPADATVTSSGAEGSELRLYNALGQQVRRQPLVAGGGVLSTSDLPAGVYYVQAGDNARRKLVVLH